MERGIRPEIDHRELYRIIKSLEKEKLIEVQRTEKYRVRTKIPYYRPTPKGLANFIARLGGWPNFDSELHKSKATFRIVRALAAKFEPFFPGIFDLWPEIVKADVEKRAFQRLRWFCIRLLQTNQKQNLLGDARGFFLNPRGPDFVEPDKWLKAIRCNDALRMATVSVIISRTETNVERANQSLRTLGASGLNLAGPELTPQKLQTLQAEIESLRLMVRKLQDASDLKMTRKESSG